MLNNYVQNVGYFVSPNEMLNQALRIQSAQEYYKNMMLSGQVEKNNKVLVEAKVSLVLAV